MSLERVAEAGDVPVGEVRVARCGDRSLALANVDGTLYAIDNVCTHDGGVLGEGELDDNAVECPRHGGRFDLFTGRVLALPPVRPVNAYATHVEDGQVVVDLS